MPLEQQSMSTLQGSLGLKPDSSNNQSPGSWPDSGSWMQPPMFSGGDALASYHAMAAYQQAYWNGQHAMHYDNQMRQEQAYRQNLMFSSTPWAVGEDPSQASMLSESFDRTAKKRSSRKGKKAAQAAALAASNPVPYSMENLEDGSESDGEENCSIRDKFGDPQIMYDDDDLCQKVMGYMTECSPDEQHALLRWMLRYIKNLSLSKYGTHVVQKLLENVNKVDKEKMVQELQPCIKELYESAHGNHVLAKVVEQLPSATVQFIVKEFRGKAREVARHQYGCRILERLIEHCPDDGEMVSLLDEIVHDAESLCRHPFGNFVVQHLLEHGSNERRQAILRQVQSRLPFLAMHRTASHFVQQLLDYVDADAQKQIVTTLLEAKAPESLQEVAGSRYGSFVVEQTASVESMYDEVRAALHVLLPYFTDSQKKFAKRVIDKFDLRPALANVSP